MSHDTDIVSCREAVEVRQVPTGALLVDMNSGRCFRLNRVGAEVWSLLQASRPLADVCTHIASKYSLPLDQAQREIGSLVDDLAREQLVTSRPVGDTQP